jgi:hypothetical protein
MRWVFGILIGLFLFGTTAGWGVDWQFYGKGDEYEVFFDADTIKQLEKTRVQVWIKFAADEEMIKKRYERAGKVPPNEDFFSYQKVLTEIDCSGRKQRNLAVNNYSMTGKYLSSPPASTLGDWQVIIPDSLGDTLHKKVCK